MGITHKERGIIFKLLGHNCKSLSMAHGQVWELEIKTKHLIKHTGGLCLAKDSERKGYYLRLYCLKQKNLLWELQIVKTTCYEKQKQLLHSIIGTEHKVAFNYFDEQEAENMLQILTQTIEDLKLDKDDFSEAAEMSEFFEKMGYRNSNENEEEARKFVFNWVQTMERSSTPYDDDDTTNQREEQISTDEQNETIKEIYTNNEELNHTVNSNKNLMNEEFRKKMENLFNTDHITHANKDTEQTSSHDKTSEDTTSKNILELRQEAVGAENTILHAWDNFTSESTVKQKSAINKPITKDDIGCATDFLHICHVGWDEKLGQFVSHMGDHDNKN